VNLTPHLIDSHGRRFACDEAAIALVWLSDCLAVVLADGSVQFVTETETRRHRIHEMGALSACPHPDGRSVVTGGPDGRVVQTDASGKSNDLGRFGNIWVHGLVASPESGVVAAAVGREVIVWARGEQSPAHRFGFGSTIGGLSLDAKGLRLAVSHYGGVTLHYALAANGARKPLSWRGSHLACALAPDSRYVVTAMQETGLHGWQVASLSQFGMSGYEAKTKSFSWSQRQYRRAPLALYGQIRPA
jgi:hypothetical protein